MKVLRTMKLGKWRLLICDNGYIIQEKFLFFWWWTLMKFDIRDGKMVDLDDPTIELAVNEQVLHQLRH